MQPRISVSENFFLPFLRYDNNFMLSLNKYRAKESAEREKKCVNFFTVSLCRRCRRREMNFPARFASEFLFYRERRHYRVIYAQCFFVCAKVKKTKWRNYLNRRRAIRAACNLIHLFGEARKGAMTMNVE